MYNWLKEQFIKDKEDIINNNLEYLYCTFNSIEKKLDKLKNIDTTCLTEECIEDTKKLYNLISKKPTNEELYQHYNRIINWYSLNIDMIIVISERGEIND